jgi:hypothetical protein
MSKDQSSDLLLSYKKIEEQIGKKGQIKTSKDMLSKFEDFSNKLSSLIQKMNDPKIPSYDLDAIKQSFTTLIKDYSKPLAAQEKEKHDVLCILFKYQLDGKDEITPLFFYDTQYPSDHKFGTGSYKHIDQLLEQLEGKPMRVSSGKTIAAVNDKGIKVNPESKAACLHFDKQKECKVEGKTLALLAIQDKEKVLAEILCPESTDLKIFSGTNDENSFHSQILTCCKDHVILAIHDFDSGLKLLGIAV